MKITPLDIRQKRFESSWKGLARREVETFLELLASEFEEVVRENLTLKDELKRDQAKLDQFQERERTLQETMITAQRISEEVKNLAKKEAEVLVAGAEQQAEKIVQNAHQKLIQVVEDINELKRQRIQFESQVRSVIDSHAKLLESFNPHGFERDPERIEDNVTFFTQKKTNQAG